MYILLNLELSVKGDRGVSEPSNFSRPESELRRLRKNEMMLETVFSVFFSFFREYSEKPVRTLKQWRVATRSSAGSRYATPLCKFFLQPQTQKEKSTLSVGL